MTTATAKTKPWYLQSWIVAPCLFFFYPAGVVLLWKSPKFRLGFKIFATVGFLPVFGLETLIALKPYWDFNGSMAFSGFRLDFDRGVFRDRLIERHRADQKESTASSMPADTSLLAVSWTGFRGPHRDGLVSAGTISLDWSAQPPREIYRQPVGAGYAGFSVGAGRAYTIEQRRDREAVVCYDLATGHELWVFDYEASFEEVLGGNGPRSTPTIADGRLYVLGAQGHLHCLDSMTGKMYWARNVLADFGEENLSWGMAGSPLVMNGKVVVTSSGQGGPGVLSFDAESGGLLWKSDAGTQCYSSLMDVMLADRRQILNLADSALNGIDPADGSVLWSYPWKLSGGPSCAQPLVIGGDRVMVSSGYGRGACVVGVRAPAKPGDRFEVSQVWCTTKLRNKFASSVLLAGAIYGLDEGILCCLDSTSGKMNWKEGRFGHGSILLVGDMLLILGEQGELALVKAEPKGFHEVARIQALTGRTWNNFAVVGGVVLARNHKEMVAYDLRPLRALPRH